MEKIDQLITRLREEIEQGKYGDPGVGRIPTTTMLMKDLGVSKSTVTKALNILQIEGTIRLRGSSLVVNGPVLILPGIVENFERYLKDLGYDVEITNIVEPVIKEMSKEIATLFDQPERTQTVYRVRKQGIPGITLRFTRNWYPTTLAEEFIEQMRADDRMNVVGAIKEKHGIYITHTINTIIARTPTHEEMEQLEIIRNTPVIEIRRTNLAEDGTPV